MKLNKITENLKELSIEEAVEIHAGESAWYWVFYAVGTVGRGYAGISFRSPLFF